MPRALSILAALLLFSGLTVAEESAPVLRIQGSNTIGAALGPALVKGMLEEQGLQSVQVQPSGNDNEQQIIGQTSEGQKIRIEVAAHGSSTGFSALKSGDADLAASSRPIKDAELVDLEALGDLKSPDAEQVIAIDGVVIILHPGNPLQQLDTEQLAGIFSGRIKTWEQLGSGRGPIHLYARDERSGTFETFKSLILDPLGQSLSANAIRLESSEQLSDKVSQDPQAIGFIGLPYVHKAKPLAIKDGDSQPMLPTPALIASEDYPLARRLYFYLPPDNQNPWARSLMHYVQSEQGQAIVSASGFVAQSIQAIRVPPFDGMPAAYRVLADNAMRLSLNLRFSEGSATLDNKARADLDRLFAWLKQADKFDRKVTLVGFGDTKDDPARALLLSKLRAMAVRRELVRQGVVLRDLIGLGAQLPVADNDLDQGRVKNRRVEVWVN
ncbi:substrate-binding domain-containing protein [Pseudomonas akapageensis]|uniref:substrate-binding domain-containing protein n=1 Tax=Pseudomonas akapageensis TaxID=2609961 RepID=UPI00140BD401|nr:substrate-binding domain-containing protein [Pseudomonas akapageensis]